MSKDYESPEEWTSPGPTQAPFALHDGENQKVLSEHPSRSGLMGVGRFGSRRIAVVAAVLLCILGVGGTAYIVTDGERSSQSPPDLTSVSSDRIAALLKRLLPPGKVLPAPENKESGGEARLLFDDGSGASLISAGIGRSPTKTAPECPNRSDYPFNSCTRKELTDGATIVIDQGNVDALNPSSVKRWSAVLTTKSGGQVYLSEWNAISSSGSSKVRSEPPLTKENLERIVTSESWLPLLENIPTPPAPPPPPSKPAMNKQRILETLSKIIPEGMHITKHSGPGEGYVELTLDDGRGENLVTVAVQRWKLEDPTISTLYKGASKTSDGTLVAKRQVRVREDGSVIRWDADILRRDGLRVMVTESNAHAYGLPATRKDLPLTLDELTSIALDKAWQM
ncbi:hypothetical protein [Streptomyces sp. NPDC047706]|uniref:hypothetical protein n=1 Tax=Streptomyces sp. NPDC047706 TaxID=3365486 RepID=UPI0037186CCF